VVNGGYAFLWKGSRKTEEMETAEEWKRDWEYQGEKRLGEGMTSVIKFKRINI
jgi:hypothetical protein